jgi:hypothetical protein
MKQVDGQICVFFPESIKNIKNSCTTLLTVAEAIP